MAWFSRRPRGADAARRRKGGEAPRLHSRSAEQGTRKVELDDLAPVPADFLGRAAYLQLTMFENLGRAVSAAPTVEAKEGLSRVAAVSLGKHHGLITVLADLEPSPTEAMVPFAAAIDEFQRRTTGPDWPQSLMTCYLTAGFLDDFYLRLAGGLPWELGERVREVLETDAALEEIAVLLEAEIAANPRVSSRLALWGRRLVGDIMLVARGSLAASVDRGRDEEKIEPVLTELIAAHSRRMDRLGLTA